ncbi:Cu and Ag efflux protein CusF [Pseudorhodobacter antarcticus]|jgi:Cu/Ag efflux protein CusF|uniref:Cu and Ag efflux protein CusF n=1 Tax=Pseudorhodobacter antarcticus TaxID=1077947 RepID=A0A1H8MT76_9RHOB|nr:Cu and Ag efflux protein CusF [Pseudorhodobacter antarcticus]
MKLLKTLSLTTTVLIASMSFASAETFTKGTIKKLDAKAGKVTIIHEALVDLEMPAMTMVFRADKDMMAKMTEGKDVEFLAGRVNGKLTVTALK